MNEFIGIFFTFLLFISLVFFVAYIEYWYGITKKAYRFLFNKKTTKKSYTKESTIVDKYNKLLNELRIKAVYHREYTLEPDYNGSEDYYIKFNNNKLGIVKDYSLIIGTNYFSETKELLYKGKIFHYEETLCEITNLVIKQLRNDWLEVKRQAEIEVQLKLEKEYTEKYNELIGIKPLDKDLQLVIDKCKRSDELMEGIEDSLKELKSIRDSF